MAQFWAPIQLSLIVTSCAAIIVVILGTWSGFIFSRRMFKGAVVMETIFLLPLVLPPSVIGFFLIVLFGNQSIVGQLIQLIFGRSIMFTVLAAIIAAAVVAFPLMFQTAQTAFLQVEKSLEEAALDNGATNRQAFWTVLLPLAKPMLVTGIVLSTARALGEFGATLMFAGNIPGITQTIPTAIYMAIDRGDMALAWGWVIVVVSISFSLLYITRIKGQGVNR